MGVQAKGIDGCAPQAGASGHVHEERAIGSACPWGFIKSHIGFAIVRENPAISQVFFRARHGDCIVYSEHAREMVLSHSAQYAQPEERTN